MPHQRPLPQTQPGQSSPMSSANSARSGLTQARIQGVGAGARAHPWGGVSPFKMHYSIGSIQAPVHHWRPPLGENFVSAPVTNVLCKLSQVGAHLVCFTICGPVR